MKKHPKITPLRLTVLKPAAFAKWISDMKAAIADRDKTNELNAATHRANRAIRDRNEAFILKNAEIRARNSRLMKCEPSTPLVPLARLNRLPYQMSLRAQEIQQREADIEKFLREKTPEQWLADVMSIQNETVRNRAACVIWWDYFGGRLVPERWPHLDEFIAVQAEEVPKEKLARALHECGYTPWMASRRVVEKPEYLTTPKKQARKKPFHKGMKWK